MTEDEARKIISECEAYIEFNPGRAEVKIDGWVTLDQLNALVVLTRLEAGKSKKNSKK